MQRDSSTEQQNFLAAIAEGLPQGQHFLVAHRTANDTFPAEAWREQHLVGPWYFSTGASDHHKLRRRGNMKSVRAIVLDDVGTKVDPDKIPAAPTWVLETSKDNFQWGFMLKAWDQNIGKADALMQALVTAELQDKAVNTACRLFRIPGSVNTKTGRDAFEAVLHSFDISRVYTLTSLAKALKVRPGPPIKHHEDTGERPAAGKPDPIFIWLNEQGMVRHKASGGWWNIYCPWADEHTDSRVESRYMPSFDSTFGKSNAECFHGHGFDKDAYRKRFFEWVTDHDGPPLPPAPNMAPLQDVLRKLNPQDRSDLYNPGNIHEAIGPISFEWLPDFRALANGQPKTAQEYTSTNIVHALKGLGIEPRLNLLTAAPGYVLPERFDNARFGAMAQYERDALVTRGLIDAFIRVNMRNEAKVTDLLTYVAANTLWNPAKDWIESKPWDGQDRMESLLASVDTPSPELFKTYFRRWSLQCIEAACGWVKRREREKDLCLVLVGDQGIGKTRWLASLAPQFHLRGKHLSLDGYGGRDSMHQALQGWTVELGELDTTFGKSAGGSLKAFLSAVTDEYRLVYARETIKRPRCASFCASVNDDQFLQDDTGSRRFLAISVDRCEPMHATDMQQFWAQVHTWWAAGGAAGQWWLTPTEEKLQAIGNAQHQAIDGVAARIAEELAERDDRDRYPVECSVGVAAVSRLFGYRDDDKKTVNTISKTLCAILGKPKDQRRRGGGPDAWSLWATIRETDIFNLKKMKNKA